MTRFAIFILTLLIIGFSSSSCKKILNPSPTDFLDANTFYQKKANLNAALAGVYATLGSSSLYGETYQCYITSGAEDNLVFQGSIGNPKIGYYNETASYNESTRMWANLYAGINRANDVLENINIPKDISDDEKKIVEGETRFLRAYYYFLLTQWFGNVPLRLESSTSPDQANKAFTSSKEIYDFVIAEMEQADALLAGQTADKITNNERVTQTAVEAMLARVCLYAAGEPINDKSKYQDVIKWCNKVISSGLHRLNPDYRQVFKLQLTDQYDNTYRESIWEVGFYVNTAAPETNSGKWVRVGIQSSNDLVGRCDGWIVNHPLAYKTYEGIGLVALTGTTQTITNDVSPDTRRDWNIAPFKYSGGSTTAPPTKTALSATNIWGRFPGKWRREEEIAPHDPTKSPANIPIIRYADVLLMLAEAENEQNHGPTDEAVGYVNQIRDRAYMESTQGKMLINNIVVTNGGSGYTAIPTITISGGGATTNATARAFLNGTSLDRILLSGAGAGYTSLPTVTVSGAGSGATAKAVALTDYHLKPEQYENYDAFRKAIQDERLMEFNGEFLRRQDLKRWGILIPTVKRMAEVARSGDPAMGIAAWKSGSGVPAQAHFVLPGDNISEKDMYLPIPLQEWLYNKLADQNDGFK
ncbi:RagB/SusD family nutrient uptake outer membrane protein [Pedobacter sp. BS3]|uniref:RagB/SusD family nutrient uptake outer membrane protein n=1 Tax=Pedobacter sp. BS3 TaxID=2567937 RepID=UPI0011ECB30D|nr:RagB/SusD family nutrient uptake outer membrane protein [Pedobacter sp. BS3]TZF81870.1 RagB/SusD family nutrient uptake outer membrane protein [Pedobacter sp. BS3]